MRSNGIRGRLAGLLVAAAFLLGACAGRHHGFGSGDDEDINVRPTSYKTDILGGMHAYLNDPTGIRDAGISEPVLKPVSGQTRYVACVQFNGKLNGSPNGNGYGGTKQFAAVFVAGHFDRFVEKAQDLCAGVTYAPFPELEKLPR